MSGSPLAALVQKWRETSRQIGGERGLQASICASELERALQEPVMTGWFVVDANSPEPKVLAQGAWATVQVPVDPNLVAKVEALRSAVLNEGRHPGWHRHIMRRHRREWPTLWAAIDGLLR